MVSKKDSIDYTDFDENFHEDMISSANPVRNWFHNSKNALILKTVKEYYKKSTKIADLGCGTVNWNLEKLKVVGVDLNKKMLEKAKSEKRLSSFVLAPVQRTKLASNSFDIVVISEVLEHLTDYPKAIDEIKRILKKGGVCISSVPYDTFFSMWKPLFGVQCFVQGTILGREYFQNEAGHVNHFSPQTIAQAFEKGGFEIEKQFDNYRFTIFTVAKK